MEGVWNVWVNTHGSYALPNTCKASRWCTWNKVHEGWVQRLSEYTTKHVIKWQVIPWIWAMLDQVNTILESSMLGMAWENMKRRCNQVRPRTRLWAFAGKLRRGDVSPHSFSTLTKWEDHNMRTDPKDHTLAKRGSLFELGRFTHDGFVIKKNQSLSHTSGMVYWNVH